MGVDHGQGGREFIAWHMVVGHNHLRTARVGKGNLRVGGDTGITREDQTRAGFDETIQVKSVQAVALVS